MATAATSASNGSRQPSSSYNAAAGPSTQRSVSSSINGGGGGRSGDDTRASQQQRPARTASHARDPRNLSIMSDHHFLDGGAPMQSPTTLQPYDVDGVMYYNGHHGDDPEDEGSIRGPSVDEEDEDDDDISTASGGRHGNLLRPEPEDYIVTESPYMTHWFSKRHLTGGNPKPRSRLDLPDWRMRERLRTVTAALVMCLNIGVDPPDVSKTNPCSKLICWMDPSSLEVSKALPAIGKNLQAQFETLSMKTRYKQYLDPIVEETKRFCTALRRTAKDERVLFYYNGFGVPKPTPGGEIWVFNKAYTQYIPVTLYDLQAWLGSPCIFVWDASAAGNVVVNFKKLAERRAEEEAKVNGGSSSSANRNDGEHFPLRESIHLAACGPDEILPMNPDLPADLFTCCLTSPIEISLRWFVLQNPLPSKLNVDMVMNIPGRLQDRRTPLGELNWIFTAITDTIAWTVLPRNIFRRLFRDDLMVAALLRNFLLAERIMRFYHCTPMSHPKLPPTHNHPLWNSWDLAVDQCLAQLPTLLEKEKAQRIAEEGGPPVDPKLAAFEYRHSTFFSEQLKAFEVWLSQGGVSRQGRKRRADAHNTSKQQSQADIDAAEEEGEDLARQLLDPPDQLPIVLQVLLSQVHRLRALILLSQFLDLGPRAVNLALSIGIFPYVLKLLQSPAVDLKPVLIYIWARILAVDRSCQNDLLRDSGFVYFVGVLSPFQQQGNGSGGGGGGGQGGASLPIPNVSEHRAMCAFILSVFCQDFPAGQQACLQQTDAMDSCLEHLEDDDFLLRQWSALCLAQLWDGSDEGKAMGIRKDAHGKLCYMLGDVSPEVRAAVLYALSTLLGASGSSVDPFDPVSSMSAASSASSSSRSSAHNAPRHRCLGTGSALDLDESAQRSLEIGIAIAMLSTRGDCSPMVRKELVVALSAVVREYKGFFVLAAYLYYDDEETRLRAARKRERESAKRTSMGGLGVVEELKDGAPTTPREDGAEDGGANKWQDALLARVLSKLALEEGLTEEDIANVPAFSTLFVSLLDLSVDGYTEVANMAKTVVDYILALLLESEVARASESIVGRFGSVGQGSSSRVVLPTSVHGGGAAGQAEDSYFSYNPRSSNGVSASESLISPHGTAFGPHGTSRHSAPHPRRAPSLAQTVKAIATLGYSRPASPVPSPESRSPGDASPAAGGAGGNAAAYNPASAPRVPAPRFNVMGYVSPYVSGSDGPAAASTPSNPTTPTSPSANTSAAMLLAKRSASAESLAHIARRANATAGVSATTPTGAVANTSGATTPSSGRAGTSSNADSPAAEDLSSRPSADVQVGDALAALISVDLQRFRNRAALASNSGADAPGSGLSSAGSTPLPSPSTSRTAMKHLLSDPGLGNDDILDTLPLKSRLFAWCSEYYREPQMKPAEAEEPGSVKYNVMTWRRQRNERIVGEGQGMVDAGVAAAASGGGKSSGTGVKWTQPVSTLRNGAPPYAMVMHQFEPHLVTASERDVVSVWDWERARLLSRFHNGNARGTNITSTLFINEEVDGLLLVGSAEGDVRIYRNYDRPSWIPTTRGPELLTTFRALPDLVRSRFPSGLISDWQQSTGHLLSGGDSRVVRIWDAHRELCVCDIPTRASSPITSLSSETDVGHIFVAGFGNGTVAVYDRRNPPEASLVRLWEEHQTWVHKVHLQKRGNRELVSASDDGEVRLWDIRGRSSIARASLGGQLRGKLSGFAVHERAPVFAAVSTPRVRASAGGAGAGGAGGAGGMGATPQQVLLGAFSDPTKSLTTWTRHFAPTQGVAAAGHAASHGHGHHHQHHGTSSHGPASALQNASSTTTTLPGALLDQPLTNFSPAMGSVALHPHWPMVAYAGPDVAGTIEVKRMPEGAAAAAAAGEGGGAEAAAAMQGEVALPSFDQLFKGSGSEGGGGSKRRSWIRG